MPDRPFAEIEGPALERARPRADNRREMRTQGFRTHIMLVVTGAVAVLAGLSRPWYAAAPKTPVGDLAIGEVNGPLSGFFDALKRWITDAGGTTGYHALDTVGQVLTGLSVFCAAAALGAMLPAVQRAFAAPLRFAGLLVVAGVVWRLIDPPGPNAAWELRNGALISLGGALLLGVCAPAVAAAPSRKRVATPAYVPPPPPPAYEGSTAPPTY